MRAFKYYFYSIILVLMGFSLNSCTGDKDIIDSNNNNNNSNNNIPLYLYPYGSEVNNVSVEITIQTDGTIDLNSLEAEIPHLKYNKSLLFMFTQDDCRQDAFSCSWAALMVNL